MTEATPSTFAPPPFFDDPSWFDPLEEAVRGRGRAFIEHPLEEELEAALGRRRYERAATSNGRRHGHRARHLVTTFGSVEVAVPRARLAADGAGGEREWRSELLPAYKRLSRRAEAVIARAYLAGVTTRRVRRALAGLFGGRVGKDAVSRAWRKTRSAWAAWQARDLAGDDIVRLVLDGTVVKVRLDRRAAAISPLIALGVRRDGQKVVLAIRNMGRIKRRVRPMLGCKRFRTARRTLAGVEAMRRWRCRPRARCAAFLATICRASAPSSTGSSASPPDRGDALRQLAYRRPTQQIPLARSRSSIFNSA